MPLKAIVVGAGIAGLCAGIALRQAGHIVEVNELPLTMKDCMACRVLQTITFS